MEIIAFLLAAIAAFGFAFWGIASGNRLAFLVAAILAGVAIVLAWYMGQYLNGPVP